jgi:hypothetical protein
MLVVDVVIVLGWSLGDHVAFAAAVEQISMALFVSHNYSAALANPKQHITKRWLLTSWE